MKKAIVMGGTSGIGLEVVRLLAGEGWQVGVAGRRGQLLGEVMSSTPGVVAVKVIDVCSEDATERLRELIDDMGGIDLYVHSSGIGYQNVALDTDKEMRTVETNCIGFTRMLTSVYHYFADRHRADVSQGHDTCRDKVYQIAAISSIAGTKGLGAAPAYSSTKRYQNHYLECLDQQARMSGLPIRITDIRPGFVATDLIKGGSYPLQLSASDVARTIVSAIRRRRSVVTIDWRYALLVGLWRMVPRWIWVRMKVRS